MAIKFVLDNTSPITFILQKGQSGERPVCAHCGKIGHEEAGCYDIIGYPSNWNSMGRGRAGRGGRGSRGGRWSSAGSGRRGGRSGGREYAAAAYTDVGHPHRYTDLVTDREGTTVTTQTTQAVSSALSNLTNEQVQRLLSLIEGEPREAQPTPQQCSADASPLTGPTEQSPMPHGQTSGQVPPGSAGASSENGPDSVVSTEPSSPENSSHPIRRSQRQHRPPGNWRIPWNQNTHLSGVKLNG
ncbi:hypothetical protein Cgig2_004776 [Carnegiea gigantea]|uniref:Uncharacterized protein n=1 Tax=Carnegiea gigantea TaxID=171969 RepID=A0A9Q1KV76_9CARY|nr:hypothetical protein Cgig2_004776 [Carnegiea gigantea]